MLGPTTRPIPVATPIQLKARAVCSSAHISDSDVLATPTLPFKAPHMNRPSIATVKLCAVPKMRHATIVPSRPYSSAGRRPYASEYAPQALQQPRPIADLLRSAAREVRLDHRRDERVCGEVGGAVAEVNGRDCEHPRGREARPKVGGRGGRHRGVKSVRSARGLEAGEPSPGSDHQAARSWRPAQCTRRDRAGYGSRRLVRSRNKRRLRELAPRRLSSTAT
jgi:hypothetical protein